MAGRGCRAGCPGGEAQRAVIKMKDRLESCKMTREETWKKFVFSKEMMIKRRLAKNIFCGLFLAGLASKSNI